MDSRCPLKLKKLPDAWCPLAVARLKALRYSDKEFTEEEESRLPGCPWGVNHQTANYCFFKLIADHMPDSRQLSAIEIAHFNNVSVDVVQKTEKAALGKMHNSDMFEEMEDTDGIDGMEESL